MALITYLTCLKTDHLESINNNEITQIYSSFVWNFYRCRIISGRKHVKFLKARTVCFRTRQVKYPWGFVAQVTKSQPFTCWQFKLLESAYSLDLLPILWRYLLFTWEMVNSTHFLSLQNLSPRNPANNWIVREWKLLVTRLSVRKIEFEPGTIIVGFAVDMLEMEYVSSQGFSVPSCSAISSKLVF